MFYLEQIESLKKTLEGNRWKAKLKDSDSKIVILNNLNKSNKIVHCFELAMLLRIRGESSSWKWLIAFSDRLLVLPIW